MGGGAAESPILSFSLIENLKNIKQGSYKYAEKLTKRFKTEGQISDMHFIVLNVLLTVRDE